MPRSAVTATPSPRITKIAAGLRRDMEFTCVETRSARGMPAEVILSRGRAGGGSFPGKFPDSTSAWREPPRPVAGYEGNPPSPHEVAMARCETCGNDYDKSFQVSMKG